MTIGWLGRCVIGVVAALAAVSCSRRTSPPAAARQAATAQCEGTDSHARHINLGFACESCHPKGGAFGAGGTLASGTPVSGTITRGTPTSCAVSCHGGQTIAWNQAGPLACGDCHGAVLVAGARSAHVTAGDRATCLGCHDVSAHLSGTPRLVVGDGTPGNAACLACHAGSGKPLAGKTPPLVVEYGAAGADAHGASGAEPARPCLDCHDAHASTSVFLLGRRSAPAPLAANAVASRAGVGAEALCGRCHAARHASCLAVCHSHSGDVLHGGDPVADGGACFACHGHEGIVRGDDRLPDPADVPEYDGVYTPGGCKHCHLTNLPPLEATAPDVTRPVFSNDGVAAATVTWTSAEPSSSFVEYRAPGATDVVSVTGDPKFRTSHSVQVGGLVRGQQLELRIRASDRMRNVAPGPFERVTIGAPSTPLVTPVPDARSCATTVEVALAWSPSTDPDGDPLVYDVQVSTSSGFDTLVTSATTAAGVTSTTTSVAAPNTGRTYYWRVRARDPQGLASTWSPVDAFWMRQDFELCL